MTITDLFAADVVVPSSRGFSTPENAATAAAKVLGWTTRGSRYYDHLGAKLDFVSRAEVALILRGYRWLVQLDGRWFVRVPHAEVYGSVAA